MPLIASAQPSANPETIQVSNRYLELASELDYDGLRSLMADNARFSDPTGDVFGGPVSQGLIEGADLIIETQKGWGLSGVEFNPTVSFYVGEYAVHRGMYRAQFEQGAAWVEIPFVTVHHVRDGKLQERTDFGEYISSFALGDGFDENTTWTEVVADQYFQAYLDGDLDVQAALVTEEVKFQDPTAQVFGPPSGGLFESSEILIERRSKIYESISDLSFDIESNFYANHHAVYTGHVQYTAGQGLTFRQPAIIVIEVRDGVVTRQWDFVDYTIGPLP